MEPWKNDQLYRWVRGASLCSNLDGEYYIITGTDSRVGGHVYIVSELGEKRMITDADCIFEFGFTRKQVDEAFEEAQKEEAEYV